MKYKVGRTLLIRCNDTVRLPVPLILPLQEDGHSCVPRCVKMIFMFISNSFPNGRVPDFDLERIGKIIETKGDGTYPEKILNLNKVREVATARPSIEFELQLKYHTIDELIKEIEDQQPPIVWVRLADKQKAHQCTHAIVVTNIENNQIFYNDPMFGEISETVDSFLSRWDDEDRVVVKVKIGQKKQRMLEEFDRGKESKKDQGVL